MIHTSRSVSSHLILFSLLSHLSASAIITVPPVSVTVPPFTTAKFTCEGTGDIMNWWIQSTPLTDSIKQQRQISVTTTNTSNTIFSSVLTVNAIPDNDGLGIGCEVITFSPFNRVISGSALTIRGISPVQGLKYNFTSNNLLLITWSPPVYQSTDVPVGSLVSYEVLVINDEDGDIILDTTTTNTNITVPDITDCDTFNISVMTLVYQYTSVDNNTDIRNNGSYNATITTSEDNFLMPNVSIELSCPPSKCNTFLTITSDSEVIDNYNFTGSDEVVYDMRTLVPSKVYNYTVHILSLRNKLQYETYTIISTYQVIGLYINNTYTNGSVSVQCIYQLVSTDDGCHLIFTHITTGTKESFNITGPDIATLPLPSGNYTITVYDITDGSLYGPALYYPTLVEVVIPSTSTSSSILSESTTPPLQFTDSNTVSPTVTETLATETTSSTSETINNTNNFVPIVAGTVSVMVLMILIILAVCVSIPVYKRKKNKIEVFVRSELATIQLPQAEINHYQDAQELRNEAVQLTYSRPIDEEEDPYRATRSEFLRDNHHTIPSHHVEGLMQQEPRPSITSMATQETDVEDSDDEYTTDPAVTVNVSNDTVSVTVTKTATAAPTYASIAKRTDTTVPPTVDQRVTYDKVTGDVNKRGDVTLNHENNTSSFVIGDEAAADLPNSPPPPYNGLNTITVSSQAVTNEYPYSEPKNVSQMNGTTTLCVESRAEQPRDVSKTDPDRQVEKLIDPNPVSTFPASFLYQPQGDNNNGCTCIAAQEDDDLLLFDHYGLTTMTPEKINNDMIIVSRSASQLLGIKEEANIEVLASSFDNENKEKQAFAKHEEKSEESSEVIEEENAPNSTCQSALQILLKYGIPTALCCLFLVTVTTALLFSQYNDRGNHTEMVSVALLAQHHYNRIEIRSSGTILDYIMEEKEEYFNFIWMASLTGSVPDTCPHCDDDYEYLTDKSTVQKDDDTDIVAIVMASTYEQTYITVSGMDYWYNIDIPGVNEARVGESLEHTVSFENLINFEREFFWLLLKDESDFIFNESAYAFHLDSTFKPEGSEFSLGYMYTLDDIPNEDLDFLFPVKTSYKDIISELLTSIRGDCRWVTRNCFNSLIFETKAGRLLKMYMYQSIYGEDDHNGNSSDNINRPCRGFKWWILVIIDIFFISGTVECVNFLMIDNTGIGAFLYVYHMILVWTSKKLKKFFRNKVHLAELMEGLKSILSGHMLLYNYKETTGGFLSYHTYCYNSY